MKDKIRWILCYLDTAVILGKPDVFLSVSAHMLKHSALNTQQSTLNNRQTVIKENTEIQNVW